VKSRGQGSGVRDQGHDVIVFLDVIVIAVFVDVLVLVDVFVLVDVLVLVHVLVYVVGFCFWFWIGHQQITTLPAIPETTGSAPQAVPSPPAHRPASSVAGPADCPC